MLERPPMEIKTTVIMEFRSGQTAVYSTKCRLTFEVVIIVLVEGLLDIKVLA